MPTIMATRIRMIFDTDDIVKRAIRLRAAKGAVDESVSDVLNKILREALAEEIAELERRSEVKGEGRVKRPRGRPRKDEQAGDEAEGGA